MAPIQTYQSYRDLIRALLDNKLKQNPAASLRSQAKAWGLSASYLSRVLSGQRSLSADAGSRLSLALDFQPEETAYLLGLIELDRAPESKRIKIIEKLNRLRPTEYRQVSLDNYSTIADWHHFAILALVGTRGFKGEPNWIAKRLNIQPLEAKLALERLLKLELIELRGKTYRATNGGNLETSDDIASDAIKENHRQHLKKAVTALSDLPVEIREFGNLSLPMNWQEMPKAKKRIRTFMNRFNREMEQLAGDDVFQLNIQFYPLSRRATEAK